MSRKRVTGVEARGSRLGHVIEIRRGREKREYQNVTLTSRSRLCGLCRRMVDERKAHLFLWSFGWTIARKAV